MSGKYSAIGGSRSAHGRSHVLCASRTEAPSVRRPSGSNNPHEARSRRNASGCGIEVVPKPELEHQKRPEPIGMVALVLDVLADPCGDRVGLEQATVER